MALTPFQAALLKADLGLDGIARLFDRVRWLVSREQAQQRELAWRRIRQVNFLSYGSE